MTEIEVRSQKDEAASRETLCTVRSNDNEVLCGRPIHPAPEHDERPVCLMHSKDPAKDIQKFRAEFERILSHARDESIVADFALFVFPFSDFKGMLFPPMCSFFLAEFSMHADFSGVKFVQGAEFYEAKFAHGANFGHTTFSQNAFFMRSKFHGDVSFELTSFSNDAVFMSTDFKGKVKFCQAQFDGQARFNGARFATDADFRSAMFAQSANFASARFHRLASFAQATFAGDVNFHETRFRHDFTDRVGLDFTYVKVENEKKIRFYRTDLGQALFFHTDISKVDFALVQWRDRHRIEGYRRRKSFFQLWMRLKFWNRPSFGYLRTEIPSVSWQFLA